MHPTPTVLPLEEESKERKEGKERRGEREGKEGEERRGGQYSIHFANNLMQ